MTRYENARCPVCDKPFTAQDDVVVCPECGAPHHRVCYQQHGNCFYADRHAEGVMWEQETKQSESAQQETAQDLTGRVCAKCGAKNPEDGIFCNVCGFPLRQGAGTQQQQPNMGMGFGPIPMNPYTTPFGGLDPNEDIDGVTAKELALFVGENSHYYLPQMRTIRKQKKVLSWNWAAAITNFMFYFNRRMYALGAVMLVLMLLSFVPAILLMYQLIIQNPEAFLQGTFMVDELVLEGHETLWVLQQSVSWISFGINILSGLFANRLYTGHVYKRIAKVRTQMPDYSPESPAYCNALAVSGRTDRRSVFLAVGLVAVLYFVVVFGMTSGVLGTIA